jgi:hypothetical protein
MVVAAVARAAAGPGGFACLDHDHVGAYRPARQGGGDAGHMAYEWSTITVPLASASRGLVPVGLDRFAACVSLRVEIGVNPDSHPWADAPDGCCAAL